MILKFIALFFLIAFTYSQARILSARNYRETPTSALSLAEWPSYNIYEPEGPGTYAFGYEIEDPATGNIQFRDEEKLANGTIRGSYGHMRPDGLISLTRYIANDNGFNSETETFKEPTKRPVNGTSSDEPSIGRPPLIHPSLPDIGSSLPSQSIFDKQKPMQNAGQSNDVVDPDIAAIINGVHPLEKPKTVGFQLFNNFIPQNFPLATFNVPPKQSGKEEIKAPIKNDRFFNPLEHRKNLMMPEGSNAETKEALWYKELIKNRRKEFLQKYSGFTIPSDYTNPYV